MIRCILAVAVAAAFHGGAASAQQDGGEAAANAGSTTDVQEISVIGEFVPDSKRNTSALSNVLSPEEFSRSGDSIMAEGLKRVSGLSVVDDKFVFVRGLSERYSSALLNGSTLPSPEPMKRSVPLDLFPSSVMESVIVQKTYSAEFPGDFGGGILQMRTRKATDESFVNVNTSVGMNDRATFEDGLDYAGGDRDWLGMDDGSRKMPAPLADATANNNQLKQKSRFLDGGGFTEEELQTIGRSLPTNYALTEESMPMDVSMGASMGNYHDVGGVRVNYMAGLDYSNSWNYDEIERNTYTRASEDKLERTDDFTYFASENSVDVSGLFTGSVDFSPNHSITTTNVVLRKTDDTASRQVGRFAADDVNVRINEMEFIERQLVSNQLEGEHYFPNANEATLDWRYTVSRADRDVPDRRIYRYDLQDDGRYRFSTRADANVRRYSSLTDDNTDYSIDGSMVFYGPLNSMITVQGGYNAQETDRNFSIRRFTFFEQGNVATRDGGEYLNQPLEQILATDNIRPDLWEIRESTRPTDTYTASRNLDAYYLQADVNVDDWFQLLVGARKEDYRQQVNTFDLFKPDESVEAGLETDDILPGLTATFIRGNHQLRLGYSETTSRPDFRELSPATFTNPITGNEEVGNPDLEAAYITNYDLRWEWYFSQVDSMSLGLFHKEFDKPIEMIVEPGANSTRSFVNAEGAENVGVELELRKQLGFLNENLSNFHLQGNVSFIDSEVTIGRDSQSIVTNTQRPLQGQSDWLFNGQIGYDDFDGLSATLLYHYFGDRIFEVGILGAPDKIEQGNGQLDFVVSKEWPEHWKLSFEAKNITDERREILQGGRVANAFNDGRSASLELEYRF